MQKCIVYSEEEFKKLPLAIADKFIEQSAKGWGYKLISNETGKIVSNKDELIGFFYIFLPRVLEDI